MLRLTNLFYRSIALLKNWLKPQSANPSEHFQERNLRVIVPVGVVVFLMVFIISFVRQGAVERNALLFVSFSLALGMLIGYLVYRRRIRLASQMASFIVLLLLLDPTASYWSPGTVMLSILFSFSFLLIATTTKDLVLPILLNILIYMALAFLGPEGSTLPQGDFYSDPVSAVVTTLMGHFLILAIGLYIRYDQSYKDTLILTSEKERAQILQRFISNTSHDLRTPLTSIKISAYLLGKMATERQESRISILEADIQRLESILNDMLEMSRFDVGVNFSPNVCDLGALLQEVVSHYQQKAHDKEQTLILRPLENAIQTRVDRMYLRRAISNIIENAIQFVPHKGSISVYAHRQGQRIFITIQDSGNGILPEDLPHIFDGFYRADRARSSQSGKTGLGLAIAKRAVEMHNGKIEVQSRVGEGTTFSIILPYIV